MVSRLYQNLSSCTRDMFPVYCMSVIPQQSYFCKWGADSHTGCSQTFREAFSDHNPKTGQEHVRVILLFFTPKFLWGQHWGGGGNQLEMGHWLSTAGLSCPLESPEEIENSLMPGALPRALHWSRAAYQDR